jgi:hypothetical protein
MGIQKGRGSKNDPETDQCEHDPNTNRVDDSSKEHLFSPFTGTGLLKWISPSIHKFDSEFIPSGLSAALGRELGPDGRSAVHRATRREYVTAFVNRST